MALQRVIFALVIASSLVSLASAIAGTATLASGSLISTGTCNFFRDPGELIAAVSADLWDNGSACGATYRVRCTGPSGVCRSGEVVVTVVDLCPRCGANQFNLSRQAFSQIANPSAGRIRIDYN